LVILLIIAIFAIIAIVSVIVAVGVVYRPNVALSSEEEDRLDKIAQLELNNTMARQKYLEAINEDNLTKKIELMQEANMYENGTWAETCRLYPELNC
jgi:hypothetical protein